MPNKQIILGMFLTTMIIQASNNPIEPILSLYVRQLTSIHGEMGTVTGTKLPIIQFQMAG
ncbi:hypothetical protein [Lactobacillus helveticus]|uniref:hypothetical protein n=1 Tax=Lactobacillus helveticus TaxID=1587 RepID=UPI001F11DD55|nr:hypothetical protein [Lactobacillus helveticus]